MKKIKSIIILLVVSLLLTGCVKFNVNMEIKKDKSMNFEIIYAIDKSLLDGKDVFDEEQLGNLKKNGFEAEKYTEGNMEGFKIIKKIKNIDKVSSKDAKEYSLSGIAENGDAKLFKVKKGFLKNKYTANLKFDSSESGLSDSSDDDSSSFNYKESDDSVLGNDDYDLDDDSDDDYDYSSMYNMDMSVNVKLPYKALTNNATKVENDGKDLKWDLSASGTESIDFEFELYNMSTIYACVGIGALLIVIIIVIIISKGKNKNKTGEQNLNTVQQQPTAPVNTDMNMMQQPTAPVNTDMNMMQQPTAPVNTDINVNTATNQTPEQPVNENINNQ